MIKRKPFLRAEDTDGQIKRIIDFLGGPKEENLIGILKLKKLLNLLKQLSLKN